MEQMQLYIPKTISVGFQNRKGTYTGKLAYVTSYDEQGKLKKETSWNGWRDNNIPPQDHGNKPTSGFVLNKGVGGARQSYGWNPRNEYIRVYDPRDFEFEISVANLLFILRECDCSRGKGLEGEFVYAWDRAELVLLPVNSQDYKNSQEFTDLQKCKVSARDLIMGASYITKRQDTVIYLGKFEEFIIVRPDYYRFKKADLKGSHKQHVFIDTNSKHKNLRFIETTSMSWLARLESSSQDPNYPEYVEEYKKGRSLSKFVKMYIEETNHKGYKSWFLEREDGAIEELVAKTIVWEDRRFSLKDKTTYTINAFERIGFYRFENGKITFVQDSLTYVADIDDFQKALLYERGRHYYARQASEYEIRALKRAHSRLCIECADGTKLRLEHGAIHSY